MQEAGLGTQLHIAEVQGDTLAGQAGQRRLAGSRLFLSISGLSEGSRDAAHLAGALDPQSFLASGYAANIFYVQNGFLKLGGAATVGSFFPPAK